MKNVALKKRLGKEKKSQIISDLQKEISSAKCVLFTSYDGLTVEDITQIRKTVATLNSKFNVYRNRLIVMSLEKISMPEMKKFVSGPMSLVICHNEEKVIDVIKYLYEYSKEKPKLKIIGGYIFNTIVDPDKLKEISQIPNKESLLLNILSLLTSQINNLYRILNAPVSSLLNILNQLKDRQGKN